ncbi:MAG: ribonuclease H-like domain-containing protein [Marinifilaceae bacterium]|nr:ribonuclease H-like domain-containing protein [Marinifilaceae bacterium]
MRLNLRNGIVFFDLETTGLNLVNDRIIEISLLKVMPNGSEEQRTIRVNPGMHIPDEASNVHGIYDDDVKDCPTFKQIAADVAKFIEGCDLGGYNSNKFDIPMLAEEFARANVDIDLKKRLCIDVQTIFMKMEQRTLTAAYRFYCGKNLEDAHSASADTSATYEVLQAQLERYSDTIQNDMEFLNNFTNQNKSVDYAGYIVMNAKGEECFNFGKHKGKTVKEVLTKEPSYYQWVMNAEFPLYTKKVLTEIHIRDSKLLSFSNEPYKNGKLF